jgi:hypothetical protein
METQKEYYYTYYSYEEWGRGYFGSRKCYCLPEEDANYLGSSKDKTFKPKYKIILKDDYATREEAYADEIILQQHYKVVENPHFANKAYQTSVKFYLPTEQAVENGKKTYELKLGVHAQTKQQMSENGKRSLTLEQRIENGKKSYNLGLGAHARTKEQMIQQGRKLYEFGLGVHGLTKEQRIENGKNGYKLGLDKKTKEERSEYGKKGGRIIGNIHKQNGTGVCGISKEQRIENGKNVYHLGLGAHARTREQMIEDGKKGGKSTSSQRWICNITGHISTPAGLSRYQKARGIDTSKTNRRRIS